MTSRSARNKKKKQKEADFDALEFLKEKGNAAFNLGDWNQAIMYYTQAIVARPDWGIVYSNRSHAYAKAGRPEEALQDAKQCVEMEGTWWKAHLRLGEAYMRLERYQDAVNAFNKSILCRLAADSEEGPGRELEHKLKEATRLANLAAAASSGPTPAASSAASSPSPPPTGTAGSRDDGLVSGGHANSSGEFARARTAMRAGRWEEAADTYAHGLELAAAARGGGGDGGSEAAAAARAERSLALSQLGRYEEALAEAAEAGRSGLPLWTASLAMAAAQVDLAMSKEKLSRM